MDTIYQKYADLLVNYSLELKAGDKFLINSTYLAEPLVNAVFEKALQAGAHPETTIGLNGTEKIFYETANDEQLKYVSPVSHLRIDTYDAMVKIEAPFNLKELQMTDSAKKQAVQLARTEINSKFRQRAANKELKWTLCVFPTDSAAQESGMSLSEYQRFIFNGCFLYEDDPIANWKQLKDLQQKVVDFLDNKSQIRYLGKDIDISFSTKGRKWINSAGTNNMPSGEVFSSPVEDSVNGKIRFSYPLIYMAEEIEDITLEVKDGEIISYDAVKGKKLLDKIFEIPGARRFGEVAIGTNDRIDKFTKNMLFDEKIGGTVHLAVGATYPETGGKNDSTVHIDLLADMKDGGQIFADEELIYENGRFVL